MICILPDALNRAETLSYLGAVGRQIPPQVETLLDRAEQELWKTAAPRAAVRRMSVQLLQPLLQGEDIAAHMKNCEEGLLLGLTLGAKTDAALRRALATDMAYAVVLDAAACALVEQVADALEEQLRLQLQEENRYMTGRFSPGYGDWPIAVQPQFLQWLDAMRQAGICTTESCVLTPSKSITALCGIADRPVKGKLAGCEHCILRDICIKRKEGRACAKKDI